jgi:hypothetical protein
MIKKLGQNAEILVLEDSPAVLSIGKRVMRYGYSFVWKAGKRPYLITPSKEKIYLEVDGDIPYLVDKNISCPVGVHDEQPAEAQLGESGGLQVANALPDRITKVNQLKAEALSVLHLTLHMPQNPFCPTCRAAKMRKASARRVPNELKDIAKRFGQRVHADHFLFQQMLMTTIAMMPAPPWR